MKKDIFFLALIAAACVTALADISYLIYLFVTLGSLSFSNPLLFPLSLTAAILNVLTAAFAAVFFVLKRIKN